MICWLMGSAPSAALHGPRLQSLIERIVDTPVRGVVYEAAGTADPGLLQQGAAIVRAAGETYRMPCELIEEPIRRITTRGVAAGTAVSGPPDLSSFDRQGRGTGVQPGGFMTGDSCLPRRLRSWRLRHYRRVRPPRFIRAR